MRLFTTVAGLRCYLRLCRLKNNLMAQKQPIVELTSVAKTGVGLVPTMGSLHQGHLSLIERSRRENAIVIVSIFVNPLQFGPTEDYQHYPRTLERDRQLCEQAGVDAIFAPTITEMAVGENSATLLTQVVPPANMTAVLCGGSRPGHFQGVATIVTKLLNLVQPERAYFGQKDAQQLAIMRRIVKDLNLPVKIVACPTVREASGLAMSSRNQYLTEEQKQQAAILYRGLQEAQTAFKAGERLAIKLITTVKTELAKVPTVQLEYIEVVDPDILMPLEKVESTGMLAIAARVGGARLIDNILLQRQPIIAIDGPAGAGKSTIARLVAAELGLLYLDTGAMYRALTWLVLQLGIAIDDECAIAELASQSQIKLAPSNNLQTPVQVWINNQEVTQAIRTPEVTANVSAIAAQIAVREALVHQQQLLGNKGGIVAEGRDIGTHVFPNADLKIFLTASIEERAKRRQHDFHEQGQANVSLEQLEEEMSQRDWKDSTRDIAPLQKAADAIEIQTDGKSIAQVKTDIINCYHKQMSQQ